MAFRMHLFAFISMVMGRRILTDTDEMQHTVQAEDSQPVPWKLVDKFKDQAAKHAPKHMAPLQEKITKGWPSYHASYEFANIAELANEVDQAKNRIRVEARTAIAAIANEADRAKISMKEQMRAAIAELAKEADKAKVESAKETDKVKNSVKEEWQTTKASKVANETDTVKNTWEERTEAQWAEQRGKVTAKFANETDPVKNSAEEELQTAKAAEFANEADKVKNTMEEGSQTTKAEWAEERDKVIARLAQEANEVKKRVKGSFTELKGSQTTKAYWAKWAEERGKVIARLAQEAMEVKKRVTGSFEQLKAEADKEKNSMDERWFPAREGATSTIKAASAGVKTAVAEPDDEIWESVGKKDRPELS